MQKIYNKIKKLNEILSLHNPEKVMLVCDSAFEHLTVADEIKSLPYPCVKFNAFTPNPRYDDIVNGVNLFRDNGCDYIIAVGGGSALDVAKCIKFFCKMNPEEVYLNQTYTENNIPLLAVPTTAGTGSEATRYAIIYYNGEKQSVTNDALLPDYVILEPDTLTTLPLYQKKCTMLDALCHAIESWWSKKATPESIAHAETAIKMIISNMDSYLNNERTGNQNMLAASNYAGKAINFTTTTAPHAMCYKLTTLYNLPHGHSAILCLTKVWRHMLKSGDTQTFNDIANALGKQNGSEAVDFIDQLLQKLEILPPSSAKTDDLGILAHSVNPQRLENNPSLLSGDEIKDLYKEVLNLI